MPSTPAAKILVPGTVLLDIYEDTGEKFLGGAEFNFAYHVQQLLAGVDFIARIGEDDAGRAILAELKQRAFPTPFIQLDPQKKTKTVLVKKNQKNEPVYIIPDNVASEYLEFPALSPAQFATYALVYFGTTLQHGEKSRSTLRQILALCPGIKFCDLNLRTGKYTRETVEYSLRTCDCLKINHEELEIVSGFFQLTGGSKDKIVQLSRKMNLSQICLTLAENGSLFYHQGYFFIKELHTSKVLDTVGAGDGFSACLAIGLLKGWPANRILDFASDFAAAICQQRGAVPGNREFYEPFKLHHFYEQGI